LEAKSRRLVAVRNIYWKIREIVEDNGYIASEYSISLAYPNNESDIRETPMIAIELGYSDGKPLQLGSTDRLHSILFIYIIGNSRSQVEEISSLLWDEMNSQHYTMYDLSAQSPTAVGDYSGLVDAGKLIFSKGEIVPSDVITTKDEKLMYESVTRFSVEIGG